MKPKYVLFVSFVFVIFGFGAKTTLAELVSDEAAPAWLQQAAKTAQEYFLANLT